MRKDDNIPSGYFISPSPLLATTWKPHTIFGSHSVLALTAQQHHMTVTKLKTLYTSLNISSNPDLRAPFGVLFFRKQQRWGNTLSASWRYLFKHLWLLCCHPFCKDINLGLSHLPFSLSPSAWLHICSIPSIYNVPTCA